MRLDESRNAGHRNCESVIPVGTVRTRTAAMLTAAGTTEASRVPLCKPREHRKPVNRQLFFIAGVSMKNGITAPMMPIAEARCRHARTREGLKHTEVRRAPLRPNSPVRFRDLPLA